MHNYFRNHQLYLAERNEWLDRHVNKASQRALMKIEAWHNEPDQPLIKKLVIDSLLTPITNTVVLSKEGFYQMNLNN